MRKFFILCFFSFFLSGCFFLFPSKKTEFSNFIPEKSLETPPSFDSQKKEDFALKNFPGNCEWKNFHRVVDGDTIIVEGETRVRFIGIDTPETKHPTKKIQPFGVEATKKSQELLETSKKVCLIADNIGDLYDKYARRLAYVFSENGTDINAELVRLGLAKTYTAFPFSRKKEFLFLEQMAKEKGLGIWFEANIIQ